MTTRFFIIFVLGCIAGTAGASEAGAQKIRIDLDKAIGAQGTVSFMLCTQQAYSNGPDRKKLEHALLQIGRIAKLSIQQSKSACSLLWQWDESEVKGVLAIKTTLPELPGPEWYHLLYSWDAENGLFNGYLNGMPLRLPGTVVEAWKMKPQKRITLNVGSAEVKDVSVTPDYFSQQTAQAKTPKTIRLRYSHLVGDFDRIEPASVKERLGRLLYASSLADGAVIENWTLEGPGIIDHADGWMKMYSKRPDGPQGHLVHWALVDFPARFVAEWEIQPLSEQGLCIIFFAATGKNGEDIFDRELPKREGVFNHYIRGDINSYHISYYANNPILAPGRITSNLRKNAGFYLAANGPAGIRPGSRDIHTIRLIRDFEHIQLLVDGGVVIDYVDDGTKYGPVLGSGKIGFRQMQWMIARYRNFKVWELKNKDS